MQNTWNIKNKALGMTPAEFIKKNSEELTDAQVVKRLVDAGFQTSQAAVRSQRRRKKIIKSNVTAKPLQKELYQTVGDGRLIEIENSRIQTQDEFIKYYKIDTFEWEIAEFRITRHEVPHTDKAEGNSKMWSRDDGEMGVLPLTHIKATLKPKKFNIFAKQEIQSLIDNAKKFSPKYHPIKYITPKSGNLLEPCIIDHHFGRETWSKETGYDDYDLKIANKIYDDALEGLIGKTSSFKFDRIVFPVGHDLFNSDNREGTTTAGTPQNNDTRYQKVFWVVEQAMFRAIDRLSSIAPTDVVVIAGNHDVLTTWLLGEVLKWKYANHKYVTVENTPVPRKYYEWGQVMLMFLHGDKGKRLEYPNLMASEKPEMWGRTSFHEIHTGDKHQVRLEEKYGVRIRILPSLVAPDQWSSDNGFLGSQRSSEAYVFNKDDGLCAVATHTIPMRSYQQEVKR